MPYWAGADEVEVGQSFITDLIRTPGAAGIESVSVRARYEGIVLDIGLKVNCPDSVCHLQIGSMRRDC